MPTAAESLSKDSSQGAMRSAVSKCIEQLINEGRKQDQAAAICYSQARESSGKEIGVSRKSGTRRTTGGAE